MGLLASYCAFAAIRQNWVRKRETGYCFQFKVFKIIWGLCCIPVELFSQNTEMWMCRVTNTLPVEYVMAFGGAKPSGIVLKGKGCKIWGNLIHTAYLRWVTYTSYTIQEKLVSSKLPFAGDVLHWVYMGTMTLT